MLAGTHLLSSSFPVPLALKKPGLNKQIYSVCATSCITFESRDRELCEGWVDVDNVWCTQDVNPNILLVTWTSSRNCHFSAKSPQVSAIHYCPAAPLEMGGQEPRQNPFLCSLQLQLQGQQRYTRVAACEPRELLVIVAPSLMWAMN